MGGRVRKHRVKFSSRKHGSSSRLAFLAILILLAGILLGKTFQIIYSLNKPLSEGMVGKAYVWDGKTAVNLAINYQGLSVLSFDPGAKTIVILKIPDDTYFNLPMGYGTWRAGSIYNLGQEEKPPIGAKLLKDSLSTLLGLPMDGYLSLDGKAPLDKQILSLHNPLKLISFMRRIHTDLTPFEAFNLFRSASLVRGDKLTFLDLAQSSITDSKLLPDSSRVLGVDNVRLDIFIRDHMADQTITQEGLTVGIYNATNHPGLANQAAREVTNMGGSITLVNNTEADLAESIVVGERSQTLLRLSQIFAPKCLRVSCQVNDPKVNASRTQVSVILGEDYYRANFLK